MDKITNKLIAKKKQSAAGRASQMTAKDSLASNVTLDQKDIEIEIDNKFFTNELLPTIHKTIMSNVKIETVSFLNLIISMRLS